jgi:hypothetical protein
MNQAMDKAEEFYLKIYRAFIDCSWAFESMEQTFVLHSPKNQRAQDKYIRKMKDMCIYICAEIKIE